MPRVWVSSWTLLVLDPCYIMYKVATNSKQKSFLVKGKWQMIRRIDASTRSWKRKVINQPKHLTTSEVKFVSSSFMNDFIRNFSRVLILRYLFIYNIKLKNCFQTLFFNYLLHYIIINLLLYNVALYNNNIDMQS